MSDSVKNILLKILPEDKVKEIIENYDLFKDTHIFDVGIDSLSLISLVIEIEDKLLERNLDVNLNLDDISTLNKINKLLEEG